MPRGKFDHRRKMDDIKSRLLSRIKFVGTCWEWDAPDTSNGYGNLYVGRKRMRAHRLSYEVFVGEIPEGLEIDHLCRNRACCNPDHLEPVTARENTLRSPISPTAINSRKLKCKRNHDLTGDNVYVSSLPRRVCKECARLRAREGVGCA